MVVSRAHEEKRACNSQCMLCMRHIIDESAGYAIFSQLYGKPCGSKIESTKRTVIMPINVRVLAINVRVFYKRTCFILAFCASLSVTSLDSRRP